VTTKQRPFAPTLEALAPALRWAWDFLAAYESAPRKYSPRSEAHRAECRLAQSLLRIELALLAAEAPDDAGDRVLRIVKALERLGESDWEFVSDHAHLGEAAGHWLKRAPDACDELIARLSEHAYGDLRYAIADAAPAHRPAGLAALTRLARDGENVVKRAAVERLRTTRDVAFWQCAFSADPFAQQSPAALKRLRGPVKLLCDAFAPRGFGKDKAPLPKESAYAKALAALPDRLLVDHVRAVLGSTGRLHPLAPAALRALGGRPNTLDVVLALIKAWDFEHRFEQGLNVYFQAVTSTAASNRVRCVLGIVRWAHQQEMSGRDPLELWALLYAVQLASLWPDGRSLRPWVDLVIQLGEDAATTAVQESLKAIQLERLPKAFRTKMLEAWVEEGNSQTEPETDDEAPSLAAFFDHEAAAALLPPRARRALVDRILTRRRSASAMQWAITQRLGPLYEPRRDGPMPTFLQRLYADPGLRAVVLDSMQLCERFLELVRADLVEGRLARPDEVITVVEAIQRRSGDTPWFLLSHGRSLRTAVDAEAAASQATSDGPTDDPTAALPEPPQAPAAPALSEAEWSVIRALRPAALAHPHERITYALDLFPKSPWDDRDRADFLSLLQHSVGPDEAPDHDDLDVLGFIMDHHWHPDFTPWARRILPALKRHYGLSAHQVHAALRARLDAEASDG
jgi:hypothetical protein